MNNGNTPEETTSIVPMIPIMDIEELKKLTTIVAGVKEALMVRGKDYIIQGQKQYTTRSGFAKLAQAFGLSDEILQEKELTRDGKFYGFDYTVRVYNAYGRQSTGVGSCSVDEPNLKRHMDRPYHDVRSIAYTRAWNRAVSNFVGSADVSAEEMSLGPDFDVKEVDSEVREVYDPGILEIPTWTIEESLSGQGWEAVENIVRTWLNNSGFEDNVFAVEADVAKCTVKNLVYFGDHFGQVAKHLAEGGFTWRRQESRWAYPRPEGS